MDDYTFEKRKKVINELIHDKYYTPMKGKEIAMLLNVSKENRNDLYKVLDALVLEGKIGVTSKGKYCKNDKNILTGIFQSTDRGFGFVTVEGEDEDIFIRESDTCNALHQDKVQLVITCEKTEGRRREGRIIRILEHGMNQIVGIFRKNGAYGFVIPDNRKFSKDIFIPKDKIRSAVTGHKVVVKINSFGDDTHNPEGEVIRILGHVNDPGTDILSVVESYEIPYEYPEEVMKEIEKIPDEIDETKLPLRTDYRMLQTVTIDGEDAKDLDDAISLSKENGIYHLGVHIADVAEYVKEKSALDKEALNRGTSVYLVDRVIPMLPHKLSNGICSLNQGVDRFTLSCMMDIDSTGKIIDHKISESVINVDRRMSYTSVKKILTDNDTDTINEYKDFVPMFKLMEELATILRKKRKQRGSIDFDFPECKIVLDKAGRPLDIKPYERNTATKIIEDFMLAANETVAEDYFWQQIPFVYRTHDTPDKDKINELAAFINNFGYSIKVSNDEIHPKELQKLMEKIEGSEEENLISRLTLRAMKRAGYTVECKGHFGLAAKYYTHFTSPIRRYPDLQIHRIIKESLHAGITDKRIKHYENILPDVTKHASQTERRADDAEREVDKMKKAEYMSLRIGKTFSGVISGVTAWGLYVELPNTVEGLVHVNELTDDYYIFDQNSYELYGEVTHKTYKLGMKVRVKCKGASKVLRTVDFQIVEDDI